MQVLKIGGNEIDQPGFLKELAAVIGEITEPAIIVHGGGKEISQLQARFGIAPRYVEGLRVSDEESLHLVKMVLCGAVNTRIVETLQQAGIEAQGLSGLDRGLVRAKKMQHPAGDLGRVGEVVDVRRDVLQDLLDQDVTPVIAPICLGNDGAYNVNADQVAGAVGAAVNASRVVFLTNVRGVMEDQQVIPSLDGTMIETLIKKEIIVGGMLPKVRTALEMVQGGVAQVTITDLEGLRAGKGTAVIG